MKTYFELETKNRTKKKIDKNTLKEMKKEKLD